MIADEPENPALMMLLRLEARLDGLTEELQRVKGRLAYVESQLLRLERACGSAAAPDARMQNAAEPVSLDIPGLSPPLSTGEDEDTIIELVRQIMARRTCIHVLSDDERVALEEAWQQGIVSQEEVVDFLKRRGGG